MITFLTAVFLVVVITIGVLAGNMLSMWLLDGFTSDEEDPTDYTQEN